MRTPDDFKSNADWLKYYDDHKLSYAAAALLADPSPFYDALLNEIMDIIYELSDLRGLVSMEVIPPKNDDKVIIRVTVLDTGIEMGYYHHHTTTPEVISAVALTLSVWLNYYVCGYDNGEMYKRRNLLHEDGFYFTLHWVDTTVISKSKQTTMVFNFSTAFYED